MQRIKLLPINLINKIAAGEVIERPASVVKELVENSIDAGSSKIEIAIFNECRNIRIADNGFGIHPDDVYEAFTKHATSKIQDENDLWNIHTLGFRGEALASICSVAKVICISRTKDFDYGVKVIAENSEISKTETGCALGTIMEIQDLFSSQPARLKFLKNDKTEFSYIQEIVTMLAIANPNIAFTLIHNDSTVIQSKVTNDLSDRINDLYDEEITEYLKPVSKSDLRENIDISGYVSLPSFSRSNKKCIRLYVNSRAVKCPILLKAVDTAYKNLLPSGKYPFVVLKIRINPEDIDVNVHPTKKEIRWKNPNLIFNFVISSIDKAITSERYQPVSDSIQETNNNNIIPFTANNLRNEDICYITNSTETNGPNSLQNTKLSNNDNTTYSYNFKQNEHSLIPTVFQEKEMCKDEDVIIGQFKNTYILIETKKGLEIVDQHIADERFIFEKLKSQKEITSQILLISDIIELEPEEISVLQSAKEHLNKFGFEIEFLTSNQIKFKRIPQILSKINQQEIAEELLSNINGNLDTIEEKILITTACKAAVKAGEKLSIWQAEELIKRWRATKNPEVCPHGRPISHIITTSETAKFFNRPNKQN